MVVSRIPSSLSLFITPAMRLERQALDIRFDLSFQVMLSILTLIKAVAVGYREYREGLQMEVSHEDVSLFTANPRSQVDPE